MQPNGIRRELNKIGGVISTESTPGKGTTFTIVYPPRYQAPAW